MKKIIIFILILCMCSNVFAIDIYEDDSVNTLSVSPKDTWSIFLSDNGLDLGTKLYDSLGNLKFNKEIYEEKGLIVYGDYNAVSSNFFKPSFNGYYSKNGVVGEYRYHGRNYAGDKITNISFPNDVASSLSLEDRTWIYRPWEPGSIGVSSYNKHYGYGINYYNSVAIDNLTDEGGIVNKWLNKGLEGGLNNHFIKNGTSDGIDTALNHDPMNYLTVQTIPTTRASGQGIIFRYDSNTSGVFYQTFPINRIDEKILTPIVADIPTATVSSMVMGVDENGKESPTGDITIKVKVTGVIQDDAFIDIEKEEATHYTRKDIEKWVFSISNTLTGERIENVEGRKESLTKGSVVVEFSIPYSSYENTLDADNMFNIGFDATVKCVFASPDGKFSYDTAHKDFLMDGAKIETVEPIQFSVDAPKEMLDVDNFVFSLVFEGEDTSVDRYVEIDGNILSEADEEKFMTGTYKFPNLDEHIIYNYKIAYIGENGDEYFFSSYVLVYDPVPRAEVHISGTQKQNRKGITTAEIICPPYVLSRTNTTISNFSITSPTGNIIYYGLNNNSIKEYMIKSAGSLVSSVTVSNQYGSKTYAHDLYIAEDYEPDLISIIWNNTLARGDSLDIFSEGVSLDGDTVIRTQYWIYYDSDNDDICETLVKSGDWEGTTDYIPTKLGKYMVRFTAIEEFGQETLTQYITDSDKKKKTVEREFFVRNLVPMTKIFSDIEFNFPKVDVMFLQDGNLPRTVNDELRSKNIAIQNKFRQNSMVINLSIFDMYTYTFNQQAYSSVHTGSSYPAQTINYSNGGYLGTLSLYRVDNYSYTTTYYTYSTKTTTIPISTSLSESGISPPNVAYSFPSYISYNSGGYVGGMSQSSYTYSSQDATTYNPYVYKFTWQRYATYSGSASKTETVATPHYNYYNNYYGRYSGTVYKNVKQNFVPILETNSQKYIVYITNSSVTNASDFANVKNIARDAKVIFVGTPSIQGSVPFSADYIVDYNADTDIMIDDIIAIINEDTPIFNELAILINESFSLSVTDFDEEGDPIVEQGFQYVHDYNYFDNSLGLENGTVSTYSDLSYTDTVRSSFSKPGKYTIYRRIKDEPVLYPLEGGYSNLSALSVLVHRIPIADYYMDWTFNPSLGNYQTNFIDTSYDPDFQYSDPERGILDRIIRYKYNNGPWIYEIPNNLEVGSYELEYSVRDKFGAWSLVKYDSFTLSATPSIQLRASAKSANPDYNINSIPASESLTAFNVWTRFPYGVRLQTQLFNLSDVSVSSYKALSYSISTGSKVGQDINWNDFNYIVPASLLDGSYKLRVRAISTDNSSNYADTFIPVVVNTPINLASPFSLLVGGESNIITATTSIYATSVNLELFRGTSSSTTLSMSLFSNDGSNKTWRATSTAPSSNTLPEGFYQSRFTAYTASGKSEVLNRVFELQHLKITTMSVWGDWTYWHGQQDIYGKWLVDMPHRFMGYENIHIDVIVEGNPDSVSVRLSPELEAMVYTNSSGHTYRYVDVMKYVAAFPLSLSTTDNRIFKVQYTLPLSKPTMTSSDVRLLSPYWIEVTASKGSLSTSERISDIDITGSVLDRFSVQPE